MQMEEILPASRIRLVDEVADRQEAIRRLIAMLMRMAASATRNSLHGTWQSARGRATRRCRAAWTCRMPGLPG